MSHTAKESPQKYQSSEIILHYTVSLVRQSDQMTQFRMPYSRTKGVHIFFIS